MILAAAPQRAGATVTTHCRADLRYWPAAVAALGWDPAALSRRTTGRAPVSEGQSIRPA